MVHSIPLQDLYHNLIIYKESDIPIDIQNEIKTTSYSQPYQEVINRPTNHTRPTRESIDVRDKCMQYFNLKIGSFSWKNVYII